MGVLNVDAHYVLYLNPIATEYLRLFIEGYTTEEIVKFFSRNYLVSKEEAKDDYNQLITQIKLLVSEKNICPIHNLGFSIKEPYIKSLDFPLRVDFAITYRCNNNCPHCYVGRDKESFPELSTESTIKVIDKLSEIGVPHVAFTGGEASLRTDLPELLQHAQEKGLVTGIITNGRKFSDPQLVYSLISHGLDYVQITLESHIAQVHDDMQGQKGAWEETTHAIQNFIQADLFCMTNTTICKKNQDKIEDMVKYLHDIGITAFAMNGLIYSGKGIGFEDGLSEKELIPITQKVSDLADELNMRFIWYTPTQYCIFNPIEQGLGPKNCSAAKTSIGIEPNGDVIPCQSYFESVGNILENDWKSIWNSHLFQNIRSLKFVEPRCHHCEMLDVCGGGCPLYVKQKYLNLPHISHL